MTNVHELAWKIGNELRLAEKKKREEGQGKEAHLDAARAKFFTDRASSIMSAAEYEALVAQYGTNAHSILTTILTAKINGEELTPEQAYLQLMEQAGGEVGEIIDPMNRLSQQRVYAERNADRAWHHASGDPPVKIPQRRRKGRGKKDVQWRYGDWKDLLAHDQLVKEQKRKETK